MTRVWIILPLAVAVGAAAFFFVRGRVGEGAPEREGPDAGGPAASGRWEADSPAKSNARAAAHATPSAVTPAPPVAYDQAALDRAFEAALTNSNADERRNVLRGVAEFLARSDRAKATEYMTLLLQGPGRSGEGDAYAFAQAFALTLAPQDPRATLAWAEVLPDTLKDMSYQLVARAWAASDPESLAQWASTLPDRRHRATAIRTMGHVLGQSDPGGFGPRWAVQLAHTADGAHFSDIVVAQWAKAEPAAAATWAASLSGADDRERAVLAWASTVAETDPTAATAWAARLPPGDLRNRTIIAAVSQWAVNDPAAAAAWVDRDTSVPGLAESAFTSIAAGWMQKDPVAAAQWIERAPVNPQTKAYVLTLSGHQPGPSL
jgi:hypothetical protein